MVNASYLELSSRFFKRLGVITALGLLLGACQPSVYLMPTPVALRTGEHDPFMKDRPPQAFNHVPILYATNRVPVGPREDRLYTTAYDQTLRLGLATVQIGEELTTWDTLYRRSTQERREEKIAVKLVNAHEYAKIDAQEDLDALPAAAQAYFTKLNAYLDTIPDKDIIVYIHGANTGFYRAGAHGAQFRHFTGHNSVVLMYAWPSIENLLLYTLDVERTADSVAAFTRFIELLARYSKAEHIDLIAYSAGAQVLSPALVALREAYPHLSTQAVREHLRLGQVYFAAPDIALRDFADQLPKYIDITDNVTVSINMKDSVLNLAQSHQGLSRAGRPDVNELSEEQTRWFIDLARTPRLSLIDILGSQLHDMKKGAHDFWYSHPWVSSDVLIKFLFNAPPEKRALNSVLSERNARLWYFPDDYPDRVIEAVRVLRRERLEEQARAGGTPQPGVSP